MRVSLSWSGQCFVQTLVMQWLVPWAKVMSAEIHVALVERPCSRISSKYARYAYKFREDISVLIEKLQI